MPSIEHEAAVELLHRNPQLAAALLSSSGVMVPAGATAVLVDSNLSVPEPTELRADVVTVHTSAAGSLTGHPGFVLKPIVIGPDSTPAPDGPGAEQASAELTVLAVLTGALDLSAAETRTFVLQAIAGLDTERRAIYTRLIRVTASPAIRRALEELMATVFRDEFVDGLLDRGRAEGQARGRAEGEGQMLLRFLAARGFEIPDDIRERVQSCPDTAQLEAWGGLAATATSLEDIFGG